MDSVKKVSAYWKAVVAAVGAVVVVGNQVVGALNDSSADGSLSSNDWITIAVVALTAVGVYAKANESPSSDE